MRIRWTGHKAPGIVLALRVGAAIVMLVLAGLLVAWGIDLARRIGSNSSTPTAPSAAQQLLAAQAELTKVQLERDQLAAELQKAGGEAKVKDQQTSQIKALEVETSKLIEDLASLARQLPGAGPQPAAQRFEASLLAPGSLSYRLLLTRKTKKGQAEAAGQLQLQVSGVKDGKEVLLTFPEAPDAPQFAIKPGPVQLFEGTLALPDGVAVKSIQARWLEKGQVRSLQSVTLKDAAHVRS